MSIVIGLTAVGAAVILGIVGVLTDGPFLFGIVVGAVGAAGLALLSTALRPAARPTDSAAHDPNRSPDDSALSRDRREHAGGSRHIRTHPSWRDRLELPRRRRN
ncbi:hypothetical protein [Nocardia wallacei]|uniref:hypothetical protein n=1 Tax=Nocardia wallacei TaxID=480035 RepID=UPI002458B433|nr:hypothetical protein [Nocardia wallacei]